MRPTRTPWPASTVRSNPHRAPSGRFSVGLGPGALLALSAAALWGFAAVVAKDVFSAVSPLRVAQTRALATAVILLAFVGFIARTRPRLPRETLGLVALFGAALALVNGSYYLAIRRLPVGVALTIQYLAPLIVLVVRRHRVSRRLWAAAGCCVIGAALVSGIATGFSGSVTGLLFAAVSAGGFASYLLLGEAVAKKVGATASVAFGFSAASIVWAVVQPWWSYPFGPLGGWGVGWRMAVVCILGTVVPFCLMVAAVRKISAGPAGVLATAEPGFGALFALMLLGESLTPLQVVGLVLVVAGVGAVEAAAPVEVDPAR